MAGKIHNDFNPVHLAQQLKNLGYKAKVILAKINIGYVLNHMFSSFRQVEKKSIISKENYTYQDVQGTLIKYADRSVFFLAKRSINGKNVDYQLKFDNICDVEKQRPSQEIINPGKENQVTTNYRYHSNGYIKNKEILNAQKQIIKREEYNHKGQIENKYADKSEN